MDKQDQYAHLMTRMGLPASLGEGDIDPGLKERAAAYIRKIQRDFFCRLVARPIRRAERAYQRGFCALNYRRKKLTGMPVVRAPKIEIDYDKLAIHVIEPAPIERITFNLKVE